MPLIVITANLMQRLSGLPATPDITLLDLRKPKPHPRSHTNTTFREPTYIRWCCIDLSNAPPFLDNLRPRSRMQRIRTYCTLIAPKFADSRPLLLDSKKTSLNSVDTRPNLRALIDDRSRYQRSLCAHAAPA